ncbi:MAG: alkaline phosphatase family protein [Ktedonobacteraceae bacterium]
MRTVIFGVDGLTFRIIHPLIERGVLPNFKKLRDAGCEAVLESKYPPLTPPAWTSLSTGLKPARHGVYDYWIYADEAKKGVTRGVHVQTQRRAEKAIWNILSEYGKQVLVINVPATYPLETVNGIMVSGYLTPSTDVEFTYPASFKQELFQVAPRYQLVPGKEYENLRLKLQVSGMVDVLCRMTEQRTKLILHMLKEKPWDFAYLAYVCCDRLQHQLWEEAIALDPRTNKYYQMLDDALGQIMQMLGPDDCLFVVSDHGFRGHSSYFDINEYLLSKGLLTLEPEVQSTRRQASRSSMLKHLANRLGLRPLARKLKRSLKAVGVWENAGIDAARPLIEDIDWDKTLAYVPSFSGFQGGYADVFLSPNMTTHQIQELCDDLKRQRNPKNGQPLIDAIYTTEAFGTGPYAPKEPHLLLLAQDDVTFRMDMGNKRIWEDIGKTFGSHHKNGVLYAYGKNFKSGFKAPNAEVFDLVPTVLTSMGLPFPYAFDGRVLDELFVDRRPAQQSELETANSIEGGLTRRKLKKLLEA